MCLILFAWQTHPRYRLVLAANRDEFHARPTAQAAFWDDAPDLLAGRDIQAGGTWLGVTRSGRFAAVTNFSEPARPAPPGERSRGHLVSGFLQSDSTPADYAERLAADAHRYRGFNLLLGTGDSLFSPSNRDTHSGGNNGGDNGSDHADFGAAEISEVQPGAHGLSNHLLDTAWPKVRTSTQRLAHQLARLQTGDALEPEALLTLLADQSSAPGKAPPGTAASHVPEWVMRQNFIVSPEYGTRSSTGLLIGRDGTVTFVERQFNAQGEATGTQRFEFSVLGKSV